MKLRPIHCSGDFELHLHLTARQASSVYNEDPVVFMKVVSYSS